MRDPGMKPGICTSPYAVVQESGTYPFAQSGKLGYALIWVHCYAPLPDYAALGELMRRAKAALVPLRSELRPTGDEGIYTINNNFKAHESYVEYMIQKRLFD